MSAARPGKGWATRGAILFGVVLALFVAGLLFIEGTPSKGSTALDRVLQDLEDQVHARPQDPDLRVAVALAYAERGRLVESVEQFQAALVINDQNQAALIGLGRVLVEQGRYEEALGPLTTVADLNKDNPLRYTIDQLQSVYYDLARVHMERKQPDEALAVISDALTINGSDADAWRLRGVIEEQLGDLQAAEQSLIQAVRYVPDFADAYGDLERIYGKAGREGGRLFADGMRQLIRGSFGDAVKRLERAIEAEPTLADAYQGLGMAYESAGRSGDALEVYRKAYELDPKLFLSEMAVQRLSQ